MTYVQRFAYGSHPVQQAPLYHNAPK
jgi:hypothetical protein